MQEERASGTKEDEKKNGTKHNEKNSERLFLVGYRGEDDSTLFDVVVGSF